MMLCEESSKKKTLWFAAFYRRPFAGGASETYDREPFFVPARLFPTKPARPINFPCRKFEARARDIKESHFASISLTRTLRMESTSLECKNHKFIELYFDVSKFVSTKKFLSQQTPWNIFMRCRLGLPQFVVKRSQPPSLASCFRGITSIMAFEGREKQNSWSFLPRPAFRFCFSFSYFLERRLLSEAATLMYVFHLDALNSCLCATRSLRWTEKTERELWHDNLMIILLRSVAAVSDSLHFIERFEKEGSVKIIGFYIFSSLPLLNLLQFLLFHVSRRFSSSVYFIDEIQDARRVGKIVTSWQIIHFRVTVDGAFRN